jgi:hypothetical protein
MTRNGYVMRADRLKQVMKDIDSTFEDKNLKMAKFSRFVTEAAQRGILHVSKMDNGQLEVDRPLGIAGDAAAPAATAAAAAASPADAGAPAAEAEREPGRERGRRGRRDRGRGRRSEGAAAAGSAAAPAAAPAATTAPAAGGKTATPSTPVPSAAPAVAATPASANLGERLTRVEALELLKRAVDELTDTSARPVPASKVREKARALLGRDSETLSERHFGRILQDAHDADVIDLRRRGDDYEVARVVGTATVAEQLGTAAATAAAAAAAAAAPAVAANRTMAARAGRSGFGKKLGEAPANLLSIGVVASASPRVPSAPASVPGAAAASGSSEADAAVAGGGAKKKAAGARKKATSKTAKKASATGVKKTVRRKTAARKVPQG